MYGSVVRPVAAAKGSPAAVLIPGSGPTNRWGTDGAIEPTHRTLLDVAVAMASRGIAVIIFDKRSCPASDRYCVERVFCLPVAQPRSPLSACSACPGCVNIYGITEDDYITDSVAALTFIKGLVDATSLITVGHSQGCSIALPTATAVGADHTILLEGTGLNICETVSKQLAFRTPILELATEYYLGTDNAVGVATSEAGLASYECAADFAPAQCALVGSGQLSGYANVEYQIPAFISLLGEYVSEARYEQLLAEVGGDEGLLTGLGIEPNGSYCPPHTTNGSTCACNQTFMAASGECHAACERSELLGAGGPTSWPVSSIVSNIALGEAQGRERAMRELPAGVRILATNSWSDSNIPLSTYAPLHQLLQASASSVRYTFDPNAGGLIYSVGAASVTTATFANLTHGMYDVNLPFTGVAAPYPVREDVLQTLTDWLCAGVACTAAGMQPPGVWGQPTVPLVALIAGSGVVIGSLIGAIVMWMLMRGAGSRSEGARSDSSGGTLVGGDLLNAMYRSPDVADCRAILIFNCPHKPPPCVELGKCPREGNRPPSWRR